MSEGSADLNALINEGIKQSGKHKYFPTTFIAMRESKGTIGAISYLMKSGGIQTGFKRLVELGLPEYTLEAAVVKFPAEFSREVVDAAGWRLSQVGEGGVDA